MLLTIRGVVRPIKDWAKQPGAAAYECIKYRLAVLKWETERAVFTPSRSKRIVPVRPRVRRRPVRLLPCPHVANPLRPILGGYRAYPIEFLGSLRRVA